MATTSYDRKYSIDDLKTWLDGHNIDHLKDKDIDGASFSIQHNTGGDILVSLYPFTTDGMMLIDGRNSSFSWRSSMSRFNQKRFDTITEKWLPVAIYLCALYLIRGWQDPGWMNERLDDIAGLINGNSTYTPKMFCSDWFDRLKAIEKTKEQQTAAPEEPAKQQPTILTHNESAIVQRFRNSLRNGGRCIYHVNRGYEHQLPAIYQTAEVIDPIPDGQQFDGWEGYSRITMFDYVEMNAYLQEHNNEAPNFLYDELQAMNISPEMHKAIGEHKEDIIVGKPGTTAVFIRVDYDDPDDTDHRFFEYVITDTLPRDAA